MEVYFLTFICVTSDGVLGTEHIQNASALNFVLDWVAWLVQHQNWHISANVLLVFSV